MKTQTFGKIQKIDVDKRCDLRKFFARLQWPTFGFDGAYDYDKWCHKPNRKLRIVHFDGMDGSGKTSAARQLYMDFMTCGYPVQLIDESWYTSWGREKRKKLRKELEDRVKKPDVQALVRCLEAAHDDRTLGTLKLLLPWLRYPTTFILDRSYVSSLVMHLFDAVRLKLVANDPEAWDQYYVGDDVDAPIYMDGDDRGPTPAWDAVGQGIYAADLQFILLTDPAVAFKRAKERASETGKPLSPHETVEQLTLLRKIYLWIADGLQEQVVVLDTSKSRPINLMATAWFSTGQIRRAHSHVIKVRHPEIADHRRRLTRRLSSDYRDYRR